MESKRPWGLGMAAWPKHTANGRSLRPSVRCPRFGRMRPVTDVLQSSLFFSCFPSSDACYDVFAVAPSAVAAVFGAATPAARLLEDHATSTSQRRKAVPLLIRSLLPTSPSSQCTMARGRCPQEGPRPASRLSNRHPSRGMKTRSLPCPHGRMPRSTESKWKRSIPRRRRIAFP